MSLFAPIHLDPPVGAAIPRSKWYSLIFCWYTHVAFELPRSCRKPKPAENFGSVQPS